MTSSRKKLHAPACFLQGTIMAAAAAAAAACTFSVESYDPDAPQEFYLLDGGDELEQLADAELVVQGVRLPVHSQVSNAYLAHTCLRRLLGQGTRLAYASNMHPLL